MVAPDQLEARAEELFAAYLEEQERGEEPDPEEFLRRDPEAAPQLRKLLEVHQVLFPALENRRVGDFQILHRIGEGGMGIVYEAEQVSLKRRVAIKFVRPERVTEKQLAFFAREARAGGRLSHPGIVAVYGHGRSEGLAWIAMELVEGGRTLRKLLDEISRRTAVPPDHDRRVAGIVRDLARAMHAAHQGGVIHRDLKPQNVLLTSDGHPKVNDFGLARITDESSLSQTGEFAGTYFYMSPEQIQARRAGIDHRTDIFSLGVVLYELLTFQRPFQGDTSHQVAHQILTRDPPDPRTIRSRIPRDLAVIAGKAMEKEQDRRYATMAELAEDLQRFLQGEPIRATPPTRVERVAKWVRRNPARSIGAAVAAVAFVIISGLSVNLVRINAAERKRAEEVLRLSASQDYADLVLAADTLWPALPDRIAAYETWISAAEGLVARIPELERKRDELRRDAIPRTEEERLTEGWRFPEQKSESRWWHDQLTRLIENLSSLTIPGDGLLTEEGVSEEHGWSIPRRLAFAERLRDGFAPGGELAVRWEEALPVIRAAYPGLELSPQMGLVPIGADPDIGLWEFWHLRSGEEPIRSADGKLEMAESSGLVFVLLPGGRFWMGAQREDPEGQNYDPEVSLYDGPIHEVELSPFFLSKYEMTQGQWMRSTGRNPSRYGPHNFSPEFSFTGRPFDLLHPVGDVTWSRCREVLFWLALDLPTEAQWEYGARAGTSTPWWSGKERESLRGVANLSDRYAHEYGMPNWLGTQEWLDDGYTVHAPVGSYRPNAFGLHEVHGNMGEWCLDEYTDGFYGSSPAKDPVCDPPSPHLRVMRGGMFCSPAIGARSAGRDGDGPDVSYYFLGLRPARALESP